jgi:hypothetical protein
MAEDGSVVPVRTPFPPGVVCAVWSAPPRMVGGIRGPERGGPTRSHPEPGRDPPQRRRVLGHSAPGGEAAASPPHHLDDENTALSDRNSSFLEFRNTGPRICGGSFFVTFFLTPQPFAPYSHHP